MKFKRSPLSPRMTKPNYTYKEIELYLLPTNWAAGGMNAIKVIAEAYISSKISKTQQLLLTFYDIISSVATGIKKETVLSAVAVMYTHSSTSTVSFKYVKVKGQSDSEQDLCYVSTMCTSVFATQSSKLATENGTAISSVQQWQKTIVSKPAGYDSDLNAVKSFAGTSTQRNAFVWAIDVTGIENKTVFSISPLAPQTPCTGVIIIYRRYIAHEL